jgi:hypothetical protein
LSSRRPVTYIKRDARCTGADGTPADPRRPHSRPQQAVVQTWSCRCQTARAQNTRNLKYLRSRLRAQLPSWFKTSPSLATQPPGQPPDSHDSDMGCLRCAPRPRPLASQNHASTPPSSSCKTSHSPIPWYPTGYGNPSIPKANNKWSNIPECVWLGRLMRWSCGDVRLFCRVPSLAVYSVLR